MFDNAQTGFREPVTLASMFSRLGGWWQLLMTLMVMWTIVVIAYGWMNLPRAQQMPHNPHFLSKLSTEAASILFGSDAQSGTGPWRISMVGEPDHRAHVKRRATDISGTTTGERVAFVRGEYFQLLDAEAGGRRGPYLLGMLAIWLAPAVLLLIAGLAVMLIRRLPTPPFSRMIPGGDWLFSAGRDVASAFVSAGITATLCHTAGVATGSDSQSTLRN